MPAKKKKKKGNPKHICDNSTAAMDEKQWLLQQRKNCKQHESNMGETQVVMQNPCLKKKKLRRANTDLVKYTVAFLVVLAVPFF